jgi:hypothetical protein
MHKHFSGGYNSLLWNMYGSHRGRLGHMITNPPHIPNDMESNNDDDDDDDEEHLEGDDGIMSMEQNDLPMGAIVRSSDTINSSTPMERAFAQLVITM